MDLVVHYMRAMLGEEGKSKAAKRAAPESGPEPVFYSYF